MPRYLTAALKEPTGGELDEEVRGEWPEGAHLSDFESMENPARLAGSSTP